MENINTLICMREEDCPLSVKFDCEPNYRYESHYGKHTVVDNNTGLILEWSGDSPEEGTLKKTVRHCVSLYQRAESKKSTWQSKNKR